MKQVLFLVGIMMMVFLCSCGGPNPGVEMVTVEGGTFMMGTTDGPNAQRPVHGVRLDTFLISKCEVTQGLWFDVMKERPSRYQGKNVTPNTDENKLPVEMVNWYEAVTFCNKLSKKEGFKPVYTINTKTEDSDNQHPLDRVKWVVSADWDANGYRLPTEAEWEYAARGGKYSKGYEFAGGNYADLVNIACYDKNSDAYTFEVGSKKPNELGIYDMTGNVFEWCWDKYDKSYYSASANHNPHGPEAGIYKNRVIRGGGWGTIIDGKVAFRTRSKNVSPGARYDWVGFRLVRNYDAELEHKMAAK